MVIAKLRGCIGNAFDESGIITFDGFMFRPYLLKKILVTFEILWLESGLLLFLDNLTFLGL